MLRQAARPLLRASQLPLNRSFSVAAARMAEGDVGAPRATGKLSTSNSWSKKEAADEAMFIKQREMEKYVFVPSSFLLPTLPATPILPFLHGKYLKGLKDWGKSGGREPTTLGNPIY
ncbi:hypothetical protein EMPG_15887 [Blastomyces silverae]|uniref:ATPase inhibitor, mitochondrial n=1 Tax=Blastomyces silverae TaxID=2060906 RepID=A0A0H1BC32_9EURO|nr:hypothetical protein EMPG_15887 [Blastomyces silverae]